MGVVAVVPYDRILIGGGWIWRMGASVGWVGGSVLYGLIRWTLLGWFHSRDLEYGVGGGEGIRGGGG